MNDRGYSLEGRRVLVTGAGHGIGAAVAVRAAECGADVAVHYGRSREEAERIVSAIEGLGRRAAAIGADVTVEPEVIDLVGRSVECLGGLDGVVANAGGLIRRSAIAEMPLELWERVMAVNLTSLFLTCRESIRYLGEGASIVTMGSVAGHHGGGPGATAYAAGKGAVHTFTQGLAKEFSAKGVRVNAVAPGFIGRTKFHDTFTTDEGRAAAVASIPLAREGVPREVAEVVAFLLSDASSFMTAETVDITGGQWPR